MKPKIAITAGDPFGIGPEIIVKALKDPRLQNLFIPIIIGEKTSLLDSGFMPDMGTLINTAADRECDRPAERAPSAYGGEISCRAVALGVKLALEKEVNALVTAPVSKESWALGSVKFTGHTDFLKEAARVQNVLMMFTAGKINAGLVTEHQAIADLSKEITVKKIIHAGQLLNKAMLDKKIKNPRIAVAAVNPHAGDGGKLGGEENKIIIPAIKTLQKENINIEGPFPIDSLWAKHAKGMFDAILCMYHDQALIGLKLAAKEPAVHITCGLPFLRTSPAHGTAFDIAGQNRADPEGMVAALLYAVKNYF